MKANYIYKRKDGGTTDCYGYVEETSNFSLVCENEYNDGIVADEMVTDTNQASEDELRTEVLTEFKQVHKLAPADYTENCTNVVMSIIRTEKLKLLAEVRVRVVGEDVDLTAEHIRKSFTTKEIPLLMANRQLRNDQRTELTKLEAEL